MFRSQGTFAKIVQNEAYRRGISFSCPSVLHLVFQEIFKTSEVIGNGIDHKPYVELIGCLPRPVRRPYCTSLQMR